MMNYGTYYQYINALLLFHFIDGYIALENITHGYIHPCIMDLKIGLKLTDIAKTDIKKFDGGNSTDQSTVGFRIIGMKV